MTAIRENIGIVILAAGASTRMNAPKQLLEIGNKSLIRRAVENAVNTDASNICVVLGANFETAKNEISDLPIKICANENWRNGMVSSLRTGLRNLLGFDKNLSGVLVMLCDQPLVNSILLNKLIENFAKENYLITACEYAETIGVPAIFSARLFDEIFSLKTDGGAKSLIKKYSAQVRKIVAPQAAFDIDTPQDFENLKGLFDSDFSAF